MADISIQDPPSKDPKQEGPKPDAQQTRIKFRFVSSPQVDTARRSLLLQVRTQVLNGELRGTFYRWYTGMKCHAGNEQPTSAAA